MPSVSELSLHTLEGITAWMQQIGLLQDRVVLDLQVKPARRQISLVTLSDGTTLFIKTLNASDTLSFSLREVSFMKLAATREELACYRMVMPQFSYYDAHSQTLVTEGLADYKTFQHYYDSRQISDKAALIKIGLSLAQCHLTSLSFKEHADDPPITHLRPPILTYEHITPTQYAHAPGREFPLYLAIIQSITGALHSLKNSWTPRCFIHGDFKGDNIMLLPQDEPVIKFVDWELAGWGDPLWDVGSFIGQLVAYWVMSIRPQKERSFLSWLSNATIPFDSLQQSIAHFLLAYNASWEQSHLTEEKQQLKIIQYTGLFLLHRAFISLGLTGSISSNAYCCLHLGKTLVSNPQYGAKLLFLLIAQ